MKNIVRSLASQNIEGIQTPAEQLFI
jgi:hypothetical protein